MQIVRKVQIGGVGLFFFFFLNLECSFNAFSPKRQLDRSVGTKNKTKE